MFAKPWYFLAAVAVAAMSVGCGSDKQDSQIRATVDKWFHAQATGDSQTVCALMTAEAKKFVQACVTGKAKAPRYLSPSARRALKKTTTKSFQTARIKSVDVSGNRATATVDLGAAGAKHVDARYFCKATTPGSSSYEACVRKFLDEVSKVKLQRLAGRWLIASGPILGLQTLVIE
jgi:hypothetical protein